MAEPQPILETRGLTKRFGALPASDAVSLELRSGEIHALIGPNGAGKSTLIKQITGELRPDAGAVFFQGRDISGLSAPQRAAAGLARSFQVSALALELSVLQNVMLAAAGRRGEAFRLLRPALGDAALVKEATDHLQRVGLTEHAASPAGALAHGQRRQLEVALALAMRPAAFLLDEPMAGLGDAGSREMTGFLRGLKSEAPILLVEHDMDAVFSLADRITVLVYGRIIASGGPEQIKADPEVREAYLGEDFDAAAIGSANGEARA